MPRPRMSEESFATPEVRSREALIAELPPAPKGRHWIYTNGAFLCVKDTPHERLIFPPYRRKGLK